MKRFKILCLVFALVLIIGGFNSVSYAHLIKENANNRQELLTLSETSIKYGLKDIDIKDLPEGVVPLKVDTVEELNDILAQRENEKNNLQTLIDSENKNYTLNSNIQNVGTAIDTVSLKIKFRYLPVNSRIHLSATYEYYYEYISGYSFVKIINVLNNGWNIQGYSADVSLSNSRSSASVSSDGVLTVSGTTNVDYYLLINGVIKYHSEILDAHYRYSLPNGFIDYHAEFR